MNTPLVSTITPCFRMKPYLKKFLEELPQQTFFDQMEVVLDHNEPDEEEISWVQAFQAEYPGKIQHIIVRPVEVIGASMNRCIERAQGKYVTIWNVDDLRTPSSIESQVHALESKDGDIAFGNYKVVRKFGEKEKGTIIKHAHIPSSEFVRSMYFGPFIMFKKSLCEKAGYFDEQLTSGADFDLSIRLAYNGKAVHAEEMLGYYLNEGKGASTRPGSKQMIDKNVIHLRYGAFDKIDVSCIPQTVSYSLPIITSFKKASHISQYVPNYKELLIQNAPHFKKSLYNSSISTLLHYKELKLSVKNKIKKILYAPR
jgi:GT2 family glycosyltransferase